MVWQVSVVFTPAEVSLSAIEIQLSYGCFSIQHSWNSQHPWSGSRAHHGRYEVDKEDDIIPSQGLGRDKEGVRWWQSTWEGKKQIQPCPLLASIKVMIMCKALTVCIYINKNQDSYSAPGSCLAQVCKLLPVIIFQLSDWSQEKGSAFFLFSNLILFVNVFFLSPIFPVGFIYVDMPVW